MGKILDMVHALKPTLLMVVVQLALTGVNVFYKLAANTGFSLRVLIAYRFMFAAATIVPIALVIDRKNRPKLTWKIAFEAFFVALFGGSMAQNLYAESLALTSATFAAAMTNLIPAVTFILAIFFRLERLGLNTKAGKAKVIGTIMCMGGAMLLTFYKGFEINVWSTHFDLMHKGNQKSGHVAVAGKKLIDHILGPLLALASCFSAALSLILQAKLSEIYPCDYSSTALISVMGSLQAIVYAFSTEKDWSQWRLGWNLRLVSAAYMGVVASGISWVFIMCAIRMRGPLFVSVFNPLLLVLVAIAGSLLLKEKLHLGSVLGAAIIVIGLYTVLWGKSKELKRISRLMPSKSFKESNEVESAEEINKTNVDTSNVMAVAPSFVPEPEIEMTDESEHDLEGGNISDSNPKA